VVGEGVGCAAG